jgi:hypothetical protein|tara:strand:- start:935 stop:1093 length:159 start_codon:yes stop_codon:yes gene_type:complete
MKGAKADPSEITIKAPKRNRKIMIGANHHFFLILRKFHNSIIIASLDILTSY